MVGFYYGMIFASFVAAILLWSFAPLGDTQSMGIGGEE